MNAASESAPWRPGLAKHGVRVSHPSQFRLPILVAAAVAMGTWWGIGLPYSLFAWLLDEQQLRWVLICYSWEVPACGIFGPVMVPLIWLSDISRRWDRVFATVAPDPDELAGLEKRLLDLPIRVGCVLFVTSLVGYAVGALQLWWFAELPRDEIVKVLLLGVVTGSIGGLFIFLYLEWLLGPLRERLATVRRDGSIAGRRIPLRQKVFACSLILVTTTLLLLGTIFYSRGERILEEQLGMRLQLEARQLAAQLDVGHRHRNNTGWWQERRMAMRLGPSGEVYVVAPDGRVTAGLASMERLSDAPLRAATAADVFSGTAGHVVDRMYQPRILAYAPIGTSGDRLVVSVERRDFEHELNLMLERGGAVFALTLLLALIQGFLFSRRLTRPIEVVTERARTIAESPEGPWDKAAVLANDEVGELAFAFSRMTDRLETARGQLERHSADLERRVAEATRNMATLYDLTRSTTSTLEIENVLSLVAEKTLETLHLPRLVLLWHLPGPHSTVEAYATVRGASRERLDLGGPLELESLPTGDGRPVIVALDVLATAVPAVVTARLHSPEVLCLRLVYRDRLLGTILAALTRRLEAEDVRLASALANQAAVALSNASLFEIARRHEKELQLLSGMRDQIQEENLRRLSRELHDGVGQTLTGIKMDLGALERMASSAAPELRNRLREAREQVTSLVQEVRTMSQLLRPSILDDFGLVATLQWLIERFADRSGIQVNLRTPTNDTRLPPPIELLLYRVTQEALTNVVNHSHARRVDVAFTVTDGEARLWIADNGVGFDPNRQRRQPARGGLGLLGMRERVAYHGGRIDIRSWPGEGVQIALAVPLDAVPAADTGAALAG